MKNKRLIAKIMDGDAAVMTIDNNLLSAEFTSLDRGSLTSVADWGIYVNRGSLSFVDGEGFFNNQTVNNASLLGYTVKFFLSYESSENLIATFKIASASLDEGTRRVSVECISKIGELQKAKDPDGKAIYDPVLASTLFGYISNSAPIKMSVVEHTTSGVYKTRIYAPFLMAGESFWSHTNKVCQATMSRAFDDKNGDGVISDAFPARTPIVISPRNILGVLRNDFVRVSSCSIEETTMDKKDGSLANASATFSVFRNESNMATVESISNCDYRLSGANGEVAFIQKTIEASSTILVSETLSVKDVASGEMIESQGDRYPARMSNIGDATAVSAGSKIHLTYTPILNQTVQDANLINNFYATSVDVNFAGKHFVNKGAEVKHSAQDAEEDSLQISSNSLIQSESYFTNDDGSTTPLADHILEDVMRRYGNGIECFELDCLFNDYYYEDGTRAFSGENLSSHFEKYDVVIPYVKKMGEIVPLRKHADGTPKKFRIIGISYSYEGLLRQKLQLQEEYYEVQ